jgi:hypothetical protein
MAPVNFKSISSVTGSPQGIAFKEYRTRRKLFCDFSDERDVPDAVSSSHLYRD